LRTVGAWTDDKIDLNQRAVAGCRDGVTDYRNTWFFGGSNEEGLATEGTEEHRVRYLVSRSSHFSTCTGRHSSKACSNSDGVSRANTKARFWGFRKRS